MSGTFDALAVAEELEKSGFAPAQAKALTRAIGSARTVDFSRLTTKQDVEDLRREMKQEIGSVRQDLDTLRRDLTGDINSVRNDLGTLRNKDLPTAIELLRRDMTIKFGWMLFVATGLILGAMGTATGVIVRALPPH